MQHTLKILIFSDRDLNVDTKLENQHSIGKIC